MTKKIVCSLLLLAAVLMWMPREAAAQKKPAGVKFSAAYAKKLGLTGAIKKVNDYTWTTADGATVYSSAPFGGKIMGYLGPTPLFIAVKDSKIIGVTPQPNIESPDYFSYVKPLFSKWNGKTMQQAKTLKPDGVTGATFSCDAVIKTVQATAKAVAK